MSHIYMTKDLLHHIETHCLVLATSPRPVKVMCLNMVPEAGLEPAHLSAGDFKSPVSTYFTIRAIY